MVEVAEDPIKVMEDILDVGLKQVEDEGKANESFVERVQSMFSIKHEDAHRCVGRYKAIMAANAQAHGVPAETFARNMDNVTRWALMGVAVGIELTLAKFKK